MWRIGSGEEVLLPFRNVFTVPCRVVGYSSIDAGKRLNGNIMVKQGPNWWWFRGNLLTVNGPIGSIPFRRTFRLPSALQAHMYFRVLQLII